MPVCTMVRPCTLLPRGEEIWTAATRCWVAGLTWPVAVCSCRSTSAPAGNGVSVLRLCHLRYRRGWTSIFSCPVQKSRARGGDVDGLRGVVGVRGERGPSPVDMTACPLVRPAVCGQILAFRESGWLCLCGGWLGVVSHPRSWLVWLCPLCRGSQPASLLVVLLSAVVRRAAGGRRSR